MPRSAAQITEEEQPQASTATSAFVDRNGAPVPPGQEIAWAEVIPPDQWALYKQAIQAMRRAGVRFLVGGGFGLASYTGRWRNTKDMDFYILPSDRERAMQLLTEAGFADLYDSLPYDRGWIYRSTGGGIIIDIIWSMANRRAQVDPVWFQNAKSLLVRDEMIELVPAEELLWCKLYVFQRDHCDWTDVLNLTYAVGPQIDWDRVLRRLEDDVPVLRALLTLFGWLSPSRWAKLPQKIREQLGLHQPQDVSPEEEQARIRLLDSRAWFAALQPRDRPLEV